MAINILDFRDQKVLCSMKWRGIVKKANQRSNIGCRFLALSRILAFGVLLLLPVVALAQQAGDSKQSSAGTDSTASPTASQSTAPAVQLLAAQEPAAEYPRTFRERFADYRSTTFSPWALFMPAVGAGLAQATDYPPEWQQGMEGFGKRVLSGYGGSVVDSTIGFGIAMIDHEDLRYPLSTYPKNAIMRRTGHVLSYTFVPRKEGGGRRFGWSRLIGAYGAGFTANTWYPAQHSDTRNALYLGSMNLLGDVTVNLLKEFIRPHVEFGNTKNVSSSKKDDKKKTD
jgi:hypothetical protein